MLCTVLCILSRTDCDNMFGAVVQCCLFRLYYAVQRKPREDSIARNAYWGLLYCTVLCVWAVLSHLQYQELDEMTAE